MGGAGGGPDGQASAGKGGKPSKGAKGAGKGKEPRKEESGKGKGAGKDKGSGKDRSSSKGAKDERSSSKGAGKDDRSSSKGAAKGERSSSKGAAKDERSSSKGAGKDERSSSKGAGKDKGKDKGSGKEKDHSKGVGKDKGAGKDKGSGKDNKDKGAGKDKGSSGKGKPQLDKGAGKGPQQEKPKPEPEAAATSGTGESDGGVRLTSGLLESLRVYSENKWWEIRGANAEPVVKKGLVKAEDFQRKCAEKHAELLKVYETAVAQDSEQRWLRKVGSSGTSADRVASLVMQVQLCPVFAITPIKALLTMAGQVTRSDSTLAMDGLKDLFLKTLLPGRKLKTLAQMDAISPKAVSASTYAEICVVAFFEDFLKTVFAAFVQTIAEVGSSQVAYFKGKAITTAYDLLVAKPEQEHALLAMLINKFGDGKPKNICRKASICVNKLVEQHKGMKAIVVREMEAFLARPNITRKAQYEVMRHLSEIMFETSDAELASKLVRMFVKHLEAVLNQKPKRKERHVSMRRHGQFVQKVKWEKARPLPFGVRKRSSVLETDNRMVRVLVQGIQRAMPFMQTSLVSSSLAEETTNALFRICHTVTAFSARIAILSLLFTFLSMQGDPPDRFYRLVFEQLSFFDFFNCALRGQALVLMGRCIRSDTSNARTAALGRRFLQLGACAESALAASALSLWRELLQDQELYPLLRGLDKDLRALPDEEEARAAVGGADEHFEDDPDDMADKEKEVPKSKDPDRGYNPLAREPRFARAKRAGLWEMHALAGHVHPFVSVYATRLLQGIKVEENDENPFEAFGTSAVIDALATSSRAKRGRAKLDEGASSRVKLTTEHFAKQRNVPPHERFFQRYFNDTEVAKLSKQKAAVKAEDEAEYGESWGAGYDRDRGDDVEEGDEHVDRFFTKYLEKQMPKGEDGDDPEDDECDFSDGGLGDEGNAEGGEEEEDLDGMLGGSGEEGEEEAAEEAEGGGGQKPAEKRSAKQAGALDPTEAKKIRKKHNETGSKFASVEDYEHLLN